MLWLGAAGARNVSLSLVLGYLSRCGGAGALQLASCGLVAPGVCVHLVRTYDIGYVVLMGAVRKLSLSGLVTDTYASATAVPD